MKSESYLRYLLTDNISLRKYFREGKRVELNDVKRSLLVKVRSLGYSVPDHYYRLGTEASFQGIGELSELFTVGLPALADEYLMMHDDKVYVKGERMNEWQLLLPLIPPLLLVTMKIWKEHGPCLESVTDFARNRLFPSARFTALPQAYLPEMAALRDENNGFDDLHIHLNGALETDLAWHDFLRYPNVVYREIHKACGNDKVKEQLEQLTDISDALDFMRLFCIAGRIREWLFGKVVHHKDIFEDMNPDGNSFENLLMMFASPSTTVPDHPFKPLTGENTSPLILEGMLYVKTLDYLASHPLDVATAGAFHYYLLILGLCNKMLVQQTDAFGFEQFQKYTSNNFREFSERTYRQRFLQLSGNDLNHLHHIEGRFSPKNSLKENVAAIMKISDGFERLKQFRQEAGMTPPTLSLVAHFIKRSDNAPGAVRFERLRADLERKTDALIALMNTDSSFSTLLKGVDAAASEFDTPPEVFAPSFRRLRQHGMHHFTFHAGEDFFHVLSGLRTIYEAIEFLELQAGDRIGHATAAGVDIPLWKKNVGEQLWMRLEDCLDDLIFAYHLISVTNDRNLEHLLPRIALRIEEYASSIYPEPVSVNGLIKAWLKRKEDPKTLDNVHPGTPEYWCRHYHSEEGRSKGGKIIVTDAYDIFGENELMHLQKLILNMMHRKQIVIETLPTSNVIIGHHHSFSTYQLSTWYDWCKAGEKVPAIVIGTDDAGIFATNIYNEYCHIYCTLVFEKGLSPYEAMGYIERLVHNAKVYAF